MVRMVVVVRGKRGVVRMSAGGCDGTYGSCGMRRAQEVSGKEERDKCSHILNRTLPSEDKQPKWE